MSTLKQASKNQLRRLPFYLSYLVSKANEGVEYISSPQIAKSLSLSEELIRKDLALVSRTEGIPKKGRSVKHLISDLENFLGYKDTHKAILIGAGHLGRALMAHDGFDTYGLDIVAAFDNDPRKVNHMFKGKKIYPIEALNQYCCEGKINIGIITVPQQFAQDACDLLVRVGVKAIWNFASVSLDVPEGIVVQNENMASSLAVLSNKLKESIKENKGE